MLLNKVDTLKLTAVHSPVVFRASMTWPVSYGSRLSKPININKEQEIKMHCPQNLIMQQQSIIMWISMRYFASSMPPLSP